MQKSLDKVRILRNNYAHAEYDYYFKGDMISIGTKANKKTGVIERYLKFFTEQDINQDILDIKKVINELDNFSEYLTDHFNKY